MKISNLYLKCSCSYAYLFFSYCKIAYIHICTETNITKLVKN